MNQPLSTMTEQPRPTPQTPQLDDWPPTQVVNYANLTRTNPGGRHTENLGVHISIKSRGQTPHFGSPKKVSICSFWGTKICIMKCEFLAASKCSLPQPYPRKCFHCLPRIWGSRSQNSLPKLASSFFFRNILKYTRRHF